MARWRLRSPHYLNVPGTEWEYKETDQTTGKQGRKIFAVPAFLDEGVVVCHEDKGQERDTIFLGPPTPEMEPLDAEAKAISASEAPKWQLPPDMIGGEIDHSTALIHRFEKQMGEILLKQNAPLPNASVPRSEFDALKAQLAEMQKKLAAKAA
jgi:hypothetical protein